MLNKINRLEREFAISIIKKVDFHKVDVVFIQINFCYLIDSYLFFTLKLKSFINILKF